MILIAFSGHYYCYRAPILYLNTRDVMYSLPWSREVALRNLAPRVTLRFIFDTSFTFCIIQRLQRCQCLLAAGN